MSGRTKEETAGITHLGSQGTKYDFNYCPEVLETFINKHPDHDILSNIIVRSLQAFAR